jgi:hypothetical protein
MNDFSFGHLSNDVAWSRYVAAESRETADTAATLALLAEVDERKLYLPAGYGSMCDYCMLARHMSKARALKRIRVARAGRGFPPSLTPLRWPAGTDRGAARAASDLRPRRGSRPRPTNQ